MRIDFILDNTRPTQEPNNRGPRQPTCSQSAIGTMVSPNIGSASTSPEKIIQKDLHLSQYLEQEIIKWMIITWLVKLRIVVLVIFNMSIQLLHQYSNLRSNLVSYKSDFPIDPSVVYSSLGSNSVYIRSTYEVNAYHVLVDFCVSQKLFDTDFVEDLL